MKSIYNIIIIKYLTEKTLTQIMSEQIQETNTISASYAPKTKTRAKKIKAKTKDAGNILRCEQLNGGRTFFIEKEDPSLLTLDDLR